MGGHQEKIEGEEKNINTNNRAEVKKIYEIKSKREKGNSRARRKVKYDTEFSFTTGEYSEEKKVAKKKKLYKKKKRSKEKQRLGKKKKKDKS